MYVLTYVKNLPKTTSPTGMGDVEFTIIRESAKACLREYTRVVADSAFNTPEWGIRFVSLTRDGKDV